MLQTTIGNGRRAGDVPEMRGGRPAGGIGVSRVREHVGGADYEASGGARRSGGTGRACGARGAEGTRRGAAARTAGMMEGPGNRPFPLPRAITLPGTRRGTREVPPERVMKTPAPFYRVNPS